MSKPVPQEFITRRVKVNRNRTPQEALNATGLKQYTTQKVVDSMPCGEGDEVEIDFFKLDLDLSECGGVITYDDLAKEYEKRGRKPCDSYSLMAVNEADPSFADTHPNFTLWTDVDYNCCYTLFSQWYNGERRVEVYRCGYGLNGNYWCACVSLRK